MWIEPLGALLAAEDALRQPLGREALLHAQEEWRRAYFAAVRATYPGEGYSLGDRHFARTDDALVIDFVFPEPTRTA